MRLNRSLCQQLPVVFTAVVVGLIFSESILAQTSNQERGQRLQQLLQRLDKNKDQRVTRDEVPERLLERFARMDQDGDGAITSDEAKALIRKMSQSGAAKKGRQRKGKGKGKNGGKKKDGDADRNESMPKDTAKGKGKKKGNGKGKAESMGTEAIIDRMMTRLDKNEDGFITRDEAPKQLERNWQRFDTNENGKLDGEEIETLRRTMRSRELDKKTKAKRTSRYDAKSFGGVKPKKPGGKN